MNNKKEKIGCPITLGEYEKIMNEDREKLINVKKLLKECRELYFKIFGEENIGNEED